MILSDMQIDALKELLNIGFARTGAALSQLTNHRVVLDPPEVAVEPITQLSNYLANFLTGELATVHQFFSGSLVGDAMLLLQNDDAARLTELLTNQPSSSPRLDSSAREVLTEVGNILLNACLGMFGNLLQVHITFSVPHLQLESLEALLRSLSIGQEELSYALVTYTRFHLRENTVHGSLVIVLGVTSLEHLISALDEWIQCSVPVAMKNSSRQDEEVADGTAAEILLQATRVM